MSIGRTNATIGGGKPEQTKTVALNMASGDQIITPDTDKVLTQVTVEKPATLIADNIKKDVNIGGVTGTFEGGISLNGIEGTFEVASGKSVSAGDFIEYIKQFADNAFGSNYIYGLYTIGVNEYALFYASTSTTHLCCRKLTIENGTMSFGNEYEFTFSLAVSDYSSSEYSTNNQKITQITTTLFGILYSNVNRVCLFDFEDFSLKANAIVSSLSSNETLYAIIGIDETHLLSASLYSSSYIYYRVLKVNSSSSISAGSSIYISASSFRFCWFEKVNLTTFVSVVKYSSSVYLNLINVSGTTVSFITSASESAIGSSQFGGIVKCGNYIIISDTQTSTNPKFISYEVLNQTLTLKQHTSGISFLSQMPYIIKLTNDRIVTVLMNTSNQFWVYLWKVNTDGTVDTAQLSRYQLTTGSVQMTTNIATAFAIASDEFVVCYLGSNSLQHFKIVNDAIVLTSPLESKVYIQQAVNPIGLLGVALEDKTSGQMCNTCRVRTYYPIIDNVTHGTIDKSKANMTGNTSITISADTGYVLPTSVSVSGATYIAYNPANGVLGISNPTGDVTITAICEQESAGYSTTIHISGTAEEYNISHATLDVDGNSYSIDGGVGSWDTNYPNNDVQITASVVTLTLTSGVVRWKDSNVGSWQTIYSSGTKTWNIPSSGFEIWIDIDMDE